MTTAEAAATRVGDESAFAALVERHRRELQLHCLDSLKRGDGRRRAPRHERRLGQQRPPEGSGGIEALPPATAARVGGGRGPYVDATERADQEAIVAILREDARFAMPPQPNVWIGNEAIVRAWARSSAFDQEKYGHMRGILTRANMQPAMGNYVKRPGSAEYVPLAVDVLRIGGGALAEIIMFPPELCPALGLPPTL